MKTPKQSKIKLQSKTLFSFKTRNQVNHFQTSATCPPTTTVDTTSATTATSTGIIGY